MEHARHVLRVAVLVVLLLSGLVLARAFLKPDSFGKYGYYRADNIIEQRSYPVKHWGSASCKNCHAKQWDMREEGEMHLKVGCEVCHGPLADHATGPDKDKDKKTADMAMDKTWKLCAKCHRKIEGRPEGFPVGGFDAKHLKGEKLEGAVCKGCHDPHTTMYEEPEADEGGGDEPAETEEKSGEEGEAR